MTARTDTSSRNNAVLFTRDSLPGFDDLFSRGLRWPGTQPLQILIVGAEGSGKTTIALQLAVGSRISRASDVTKGDPPNETPGRLVLYYTPDDVLERVREKLDRFRILGCQGSRSRHCDPDPTIGRPWEPGAVHLRTRRLKGVSLKADDVAGMIQSDLADCENWQYPPHECAIVLDSIAAIEGACTDFDLWGTEYQRFPTVREGLPFPVLVILTNEAESPLERSPYLTDVYIHLAQGDQSDAREELFCERYLQIFKVANCPHARGKQTFHIVDGRGVEITPSPQRQVDIIRARSDEFWSSEEGRHDRERVTPYGLPGIDKALEELGDGIKVGSCVLLTGPQGTLKTPQAMCFLSAGLGNGPGVFLSLSEQAEQLRTYLPVAARPTLDEPVCRLLDGDCSLSQCTPCTGGCPLPPDAFVCTETLDPPTVCSQVTSNTRFVLIHLSQHLVSAGTTLTNLRQILDGIASPCRAGKRVARLTLDNVRDIETSFPRLRRQPVFLPLLVELLRSQACTSLLVSDSTPHHRLIDEDALASLVENVFTMDALGVARGVRVVLQVQKLANRPSGELPIFELRRHTRVGISATEGTDRYARDERGKLIPLRIALYLHSSTRAHESFNRHIQRAFAPVTTLDETLTRERGASYRRHLEALASEQTKGIIIAVDEACVDQSILDQFSDLDAYQSPLRIKDFVQLAARRCWKDPDRPIGLRLVPVALDHSVVLFRPDLITKDMPREVRNLASRIDRFRRRPGARFALPCIPVDDFLAAAEAFPRDLTNVGFFGFCSTRDSEHYVGLLFEWLRANQTEPAPDDRLVVEPGRWLEALVSFARVYNAGRPVTAQPHGLGDRRDESQGLFLFFRTWHSRAFSDPQSENAVPVRIGKYWTPTRGGWFWGVVDTGTGKKLAADILSFALSPQMAVHRIAQRVYLPADERLLQADPTADISIYNIGLMKKEYERSRSRAAIKRYHECSPFLYDFFQSFVDRIRRRRAPEEHALREWLESRLDGLRNTIDEIYKADSS